jgi:beta-mannosidase
MPIQQIMSLNGVWQITADTEGSLDKQQLPFRDPEGIEWHDIPVPSHWQTTALPGYQGTVWYKTHFAAPVQGDGKRYFLRFGGSDYLTEAWLNGVYLGVHEGDFDPFEFEVGLLLKEGEDNRLIVKVTAALDPNPEQKSIVKGGLYHWDCLPIRQAGIPDFPDVPSSCNPQYPNPVINPGGIWRDVELVERNASYLRDVQVTPVLHEDGTATVFAKVDTSSSDAAARPHLRMTVTPHNFEDEGQLATDTHEKSLPLGRSTHTLSCELPEPRLWWTRDLGDQPLYRCAIELVQDGDVIDTAERVFGVREIKQEEDWTIVLNGKPLFVKGTNYLSDQFLSQVDEETYRRDVELMLEMNLNMVRVFAHLEREEFYSLCDERGLLVFQDLPFQWGYQSDAQFIRRAEEVVTRYVRQVQHHPCIALWCCHSESRLFDYNKLDQVLFNLVRALDPYRPVQRNSVLADVGELPKAFRDLETYGAYIPDHLTVHWVGWYWGELRDKEHYNPLFISEYGTQSVPNRESLEKFIPENALWPPDWDVWRSKGFQTNIYEKNFGPFPDTLDELIRVTQEYQARFYKEHTETLRRKKYHNVKGILTFHFANCWPAIDWSILDYYRQPKLAFEAVKKAFAPLLLSFKGDLQDGEVWIEPWIVNDYRQEFAGMHLRYRVTATATGEEMSRGEVFDIGVPSDGAEKLLRIVSQLPEGVTEVHVEGTLSDADGHVLMENDAIIYPLSTFEGIETAADAKVGL